MNDERPQNDHLWPAGQSADEERQLAEAWQALDGALLSVEASAGFEPLSESRIQMLAAQVARQVAAERRRRARRLALAAALLLAVGVGVWSLSSNRTGQQGQMANAPAANQSPDIAASSQADATQAGEAAWSEDEWLADVSNVRLEVEAVEESWAIPPRSWSDVQEQMDELENELENDVSL